MLSINLRSENIKIAASTLLVGDAQCFGYVLLLLSYALLGAGRREVRQNTSDQLE